MTGYSSFHLLQVVLFAVFLLYGHFLGVHLMELQGKIGSIYLSSILQMLCNDKKTGVLRVWCKQLEVKIYLNDGIIVYAVSSEKIYRLGYLLLQSGIITSDVLKECLRISRHRKQAIGKTMVEQGCITLENLEQFMKAKVQQTLYNLFTWKKGLFEYTDKKLNLGGHIVTRLNTIELVLEASRRADEKADLLNRQSPLTDIVSNDHEK